MKITAENYGNKVTVELAEDSDVNDALEACVIMLRALSYQQRSIEYAILSKANDIKIMDKYENNANTDID